MKKAIVITSIAHPTEAVKKLARQPSWTLFVVGDRKSPRDWHHPEVTYLSAAAQEKMDFRVTPLLPWNHYARKMLGYLSAIASGATLLVDIDDDNIPKPDWDVPPFDGPYHTTAVDQGFVNIYTWFSDQFIWPRGFPLNRIRDEQTLVKPSGLTTRSARIGVWQGLADQDPDVDAIYRLTANRSCWFKEREPVALARGTVCPFNSQNTAFTEPLFALLYLPAHVPFRFTDILRGLVAQPILWAAGYQLGFTRATVIQERNPHDLLKDFESEIPCYLWAERIVEIVSGVVTSRMSVADNLRSAYGALRRQDMVTAAELDLLEAWLRDLQHSAS
jgi:hypothetical protein